MFKKNAGVLWYLLIDSLCACMYFPLHLCSFSCFSINSLIFMLGPSFGLDLYLDKDIYSILPEPHTEYLNCVNADIADDDSRFLLCSAFIKLMERSMKHFNQYW